MTNQKKLITENEINVPNIVTSQPPNDSGVMVVDRILPNPSKTTIPKMNSFSSGLIRLLLVVGNIVKL